MVMRRALMNGAMTSRAAATFAAHPLLPTRAGTEVDRATSRRFASLMHLRTRGAAALSHAVTMRAVMNLTAVGHAVTGRAAAVIPGAAIIRTTVRSGSRRHA